MALLVESCVMQNNYGYEPKTRFFYVMQPNLEGPEAEIDYDSGEESDAGDGDTFDDVDDDDDDPFSNAPAKTENREHSNPQSYSW